MSFNNGVRYGDKSGMGETGLALLRRRKTTTEQENNPDGLRGLRTRSPCGLPCGKQLKPEEKTTKMMHTQSDLETMIDNIKVSISQASDDRKHQASKRWTKVSNCQRSWDKIRIQIGTIRPIRVDHTNFFQVAIETHSLNQEKLVFRGAYKLLGNVDVPIDRSRSKYRFRDARCTCSGLWSQKAPQLSLF
jgi:hypothetical protein